MREKSLLQLFLVLNAALAGAFVVYLFLSTHRQPQVVATTFPATNRISAPPRQPPTVALKGATNAGATPPTSAAPTNFLAPTPRESAKPRLTPANKKFTWQDVQSDSYRIYLENLRLSGCPEDKVRSIALADINELFAQRRLKDAVAQDLPWWRFEANYALATASRFSPEKDQQIEEERRELIARLLGPGAVESKQGETTVGGVARLTGPVLGRLPPERLSAVQENCNSSYERRQNVLGESFNANKPLNQVDEARMREQTRVELRRVLNAQEMEEFLLRNSNNAFQLREELRGFEPTPDEFRKIFRATDPLDHAMQLEFGGPEALSDKQRERWQRQRDAAIKEVLPPQRHAAYLLIKDPLYRQAQMYAQQYGAPAKTIQPIYEMTKAVESQRQAIINNARLTPEQKAAELQKMNLEQQQRIQRIIGEANAPR